MLGPGTWHNAGCLKFGTDGKLYIGVGENQQREPAQSLNSLLGKVLRINADGSIPEDNPFYNVTTGKYRAIWAYGFRNPFTFDVQAATGRIFVNDVGSAFWEEINELKKGANYGWPGTEGAPPDPSVETPLYTYRPHRERARRLGHHRGGVLRPAGRRLPVRLRRRLLLRRLRDGRREADGRGQPGDRDVRHRARRDHGHRRRARRALYYLIRAENGGRNGRVLRVEPEGRPSTRRRRRRLRLRRSPRTRRAGP